MAIDESNGTGQQEAATSDKASDATTAILDGDKPLVPPSDVGESETEQPGEVDWKAKLDDATATHTKALEELQHKYDSAMGRANKADEQSDRLSRIEGDLEESRVTMSGMPNLFKALAKTIASGDTSSAETALDKAVVDNEANRAQNEAVQRYQAKGKLFATAIESLEDRDARQVAWQAEEKRLLEAKSQDMGGFDDLIFGARQAKIDGQLAAKDAETEDKIKQARAKWAEAAGVMDTDSGAGAGSATGDTTFIQNFGDPEKGASPDDFKRGLAWAKKEGYLK